MTHRIITVAIFVPILVLRCAYESIRATKEAAADEWRGFKRSLKSPYRG